MQNNNNEAGKIIDIFQEGFTLGAFPSVLASSSDITISRNSVALAKNFTPNPARGYTRRNSLKEEFNLEKEPFATIVHEFKGRGLHLIFLVMEEGDRSFEILVFYKGELIFSRKNLIIYKKYPMRYATTSDGLYIFSKGTHPLLLRFKGKGEEDTDIEKDTRIEGDEVFGKFTSQYTNAKLSLVVDNYLFGEKATGIIMSSYYYGSDTVNVFSSLRSYLKYWKVLEPSGSISSYPDWMADTQFEKDDVVNLYGRIYEAQNTGISGAGLDPPIHSRDGEVVQEGNVKWLYLNTGYGILKDVKVISSNYKTMQFTADIVRALSPSMQNRKISTTKWQAGYFMSKEELERQKEEEQRKKEEEQRKKEEAIRLRKELVDRVDMDGFAKDFDNSQYLRLVFRFSAGSFLNWYERSTTQDIRNFIGKIKDTLATGQKAVKFFDYYKSTYGISKIHSTGSYLNNYWDFKISYSTIKSLPNTDKIKSQYWEIGTGIVLTKQELQYKKDTEKAEKERLEKELADKAEAERLAKEAAEKRLAKEAAEKRLAKEEAEAERLAKEEAEAERLKKESNNGDQNA